MGTRFYRINIYKEWYDLCWHCKHAYHSNHIKLFRTTSQICPEWILRRDQITFDNKQATSNSWFRWTVRYEDLAISKVGGMHYILNFKTLHSRLSETSASSSRGIHPGNRPGNRLCNHGPSETDPELRRSRCSSGAPLPRLAWDRRNTRLKLRDRSRHEGNGPSMRWMLTTRFTCRRSPMTACQRRIFPCHSCTLGQWDPADFYPLGSLAQHFHPPLNVPLKRGWEQHEIKNHDHEIARRFSK